MRFDDYQKASRKTAVYPKLGHSAVYPALGLAGETGELVEKVKKLARDDDFKFSQQRREMIIKEAGDVLWYLSNLMYELDITLNEVAEANLAKLAKRAKAGKIQGDGDER